MASFVWSDLSTYDLGAARQDYAHILGWTVARDPDYALCRCAAGEVAALYPMPRAMRAINMPSFWMSYVAVDDVPATVARAQDFPGAKIEVPPEPSWGGGTIALIRDPAGAGFTVYQGLALNQARQGSGALVGISHHLADLATIQPFYEALFDWTFVPLPSDPWPTYAVKSSDGRQIARVEEVPPSIRGDFSYWMPCFAIADWAAFLGRLQSCGGDLVHDLGAGRYMVADRQLAHFMVQAPS